MGEMMTLRGIVLSRYKTIGAFADAVGWKRSKTSRVLNGTQIPDVNDVSDMAKCLEITSQETFMQIFFCSLSIKWTNDTRAS